MWNVIALGTIGGALALAALSAHSQTVNRQAILRWNAPTTCTDGAAIADCPVRGYSIQRRVDNVWIQVGTTDASVVTFTEGNLPLGTHTYRVLATSDAGPSEPSNEDSKAFNVPGAPSNLVITVTITISE